MLKDFFADEDSFRGGVLVSAGDVDGMDDNITGTGPVVRVVGGDDLHELRHFLADDGEVREAKDVNHDGRNDLITQARRDDEPAHRRGAARPQTPPRPSVTTISPNHRYHRATLPDLTVGVVARGQTPVTVRDWAVIVTSFNGCRCATPCRTPRTRHSRGPARRSAAAG